MLSTSHISKDIIGSKSTILKNKKIALCITGSVAAIQCPILARELMRNGAEVFAVMTPSALNLISADLMQWATGNKVVTKLDGLIEHIELAGSHPGHVDLVLIAPCTANTISKIACGIDDTTVTTVVSTAFGAGIPIAIVPAMHESMYNHPVVKENIEKLKKLGVIFISPRLEEGKAKIATIESIVARTINILTKRNDYEGLRVLVTAGGTREYIDPIRFIGNASSGRTGVEIALEADARGAKVTLIYGVGTVEPPEHIKTIRVETGAEMLQAILNEIKTSKYDIIIHPAAVADYGPANTEKYKIPTGKTELTVQLKPLPKIINEIRKVDRDVFLVGFKAETNVSEEELVRRAYNKLKESDLDLIAANDVSKEGRGFKSLTNELYVVDHEMKVHHIPLTHKREVAAKLMDIILDYFKRRKETTR
ncbi:MAG: bifunctional phosphopantothenoylcysteine decarboxylase/phosphopantothenate--cysteine ligase CoaBC [Candidatus Odinarchaeum yellowstonii]|uniref:Coenzyme A biosynthesis bifunctional protein CoaBC n=1 Tax=Odinarchaeota yellowstonii (strain LCB_4) TaxID=1841599 RepID=A0AAF0D2U3_ODILC|nr:MAG: bifunctional phosphopantothenoylcysteine decarboxylase/phosphopantothenate--cysteine ligase CoaBC [Candidatus Odinarchaeum yellowstonii]